MFSAPRAKLSEPRRNTSKSSFEVSRSGSKEEPKAEPWFHFWFLFGEFWAEVETRVEPRFQFGAMQTLWRFEHITMAGIPLKSSLIPYEKEILALRRKRPPVPYRRIVEMLRKNYGLSIQHPAIVKFMKRSRRRNARKAEVPFPRPVLNKPPQWIPLAKSSEEPKPKFEFTYSERYNLTRLPPEEAAARRKKLEAEGH